VTALTATKPTTRDQLERLALWTVRGKFPDSHISSVLAKLIPDMDPATALVRYGHLVEAVAVEYQWEAGALDVCEVLPGAEGTDLEGQASEAIRTAVDLALDELLDAAGNELAA
jgi:hypothetical protein